MPSSSIGLRPSRSLSAPSTGEQMKLRPADRAAMEPASCAARPKSPSTNPRSSSGSTGISIPIAATSMNRVLKISPTADFLTISPHPAARGTFTPTPELYAAAARGGELNVEIVRRAHDAGVLRQDVTVNDLGLIFEQLASITIGAPDRDRNLRQRYLALLLDAMRTPPTHEPLPTPAPTDRELQRRWQRR